MPSEILRRPLDYSSGAMLLKGKDEDENDPSASLLLDSNKTMPIKPLLSKALSFTSTTHKNNNNVREGAPYAQQKRRRRAASEDSLASVNDTDRSSRSSFGHDVRHVASETFHLTRLSLKMLTYLGVGYKWITRFLALGCYAVLLFPGFVQVGYYYFFSSQIRRSIVYGDKPRNRLDLYLPKNSNGPKPVVAFITGGAWIIGSTVIRERYHCGLHRLQGYHCTHRQRRSPEHPEIFNQPVPASSSLHIYLVFAVFGLSTILSCSNDPYSMLFLFYLHVSWLFASFLGFVFCRNIERKKKRCKVSGLMSFLVNYPCPELSQ